MINKGRPPRSCAAAAISALLLGGARVVSVDMHTPFQASAEPGRWAALPSNFSGAYFTIKLAWLDPGGREYRAEFTGYDDLAPMVAEFAQTALGKKG